MYITTIVNILILQHKI